MAESYAVETQLRVRMRPVEDDERWALEHTIANREPKRFDGLDPTTASWLIRIEAKLDCLLATMGLPQESAPLTGEPRAVQLSESGLVLQPEDALSVGDLLLVELELPGPPPHTLMGLARATDVPGLAPGAVHLVFEALHESDRAAIVAHSLDVQRRALRLRSGIDGDPT